MRSDSKPAPAWGPGEWARRLPALVAAAVLTLAAAAAEPIEPADKSRYTLFQPTPAALMRSLESDRPDKTESPITVDAGHFQLEMDLVSFTQDSGASADGARQVTAWSLGPVNLKLGLLNNLDAQLVLEPYQHVRIEGGPAPADAATTRSGYGDTTLRAKLNLWGNEGGPTALGLLPFITWPTSQLREEAGRLQGGLLLPFAFELPFGFDAGAQTGFECVRSSDLPEPEYELVNSITLNRSLSGKLSAYVEFWSLVSTAQSSAWQGTFDFGINYLVTDNFKLDAGLNVGVTPAADDWTPFVGLTWRR